MKNTSIIITATLALGLSFASQATAAQSSVERLMGSLISSAISATQAEISQEVQQNIANASYHLSLDTAPKGRVSVQDIGSENVLNKESAGEE